MPCQEDLTLYKDVPIGTGFKVKLIKISRFAWKMSSTLQFQRLPFKLFSLLIFLSFNTAFPYDIIPRLDPLRGRVRRLPETSGASLSDDFQTFYYTQTLDHFNYRPESYTTFKQRYLINFKYWGGANVSAPIFAYLGAEAPIEYDLAFVGFLTENAAQFGALVVYIEHRFYGESVPFRSFIKALENANIRGHFNSAQALADYAEILIYLKKKLSAPYSPVIVIGGSYGGMLASWFRLKYPHVALGALASSAPLLYFDNITPQDAYFWVVTKDFREASESCYQTIRKSWGEIDKVASQPNGLSILSQRFNTCYPLKDPSDLKQFLISIYADAAQYDAPPDYPVNMICDAIDEGPFGKDILSKIFAGVVASSGTSRCYVNPDDTLTQTDDDTLTQTDLGWEWQTYPFTVSSRIKQCKTEFGVVPRPHWITTYYGGNDIKLILQRFGSNIIFSNGLRDPYSSGGILQNISDTVLAVYTVNEATDPQWLIKQRKTEVEIIKAWIAKYYADLLAYKH
uniref:Lysosomal Pro-X carboxypeptidase n=1 Tax=Manihot esculenta TaxID=3983 RepID=A0A2C9UN91_MANES